MDDDTENTVESLTAEAHAARDRGDTATAERLFAQRTRMHPEEDEADADDAEAEPFDIPSPEQAQINGMTRAMEEADPGAYRELVAEWGDGPNMAANLRYAAASAERLIGNDRSLRELFSTEIEDPATGHVMVLGNHPALVKLASRIGRQLKHGDPNGIPAPRQPKPSRSAMPTNTTSNDPETQIAELTEQLHAARSRGDNIAAQRLDQQRSAITSRLYAGPIVGSGGRSA